MLYDEAINIIWYLAYMLITTIFLLIVFSISGVLDHLVRFFQRHQTRDQFDDVESVASLQGQLSQLFHLFDSGLDQSFIDALPIFLYKDIVGLKNPNFDCAVCLSEFEPDDNLRLLPKCSHAFHVECIDTWLLSRSTCPLCRAILLPADNLSSRSNNNNNASREIDLEEEEGYSVVLPRSSTSSDGELGSVSIRVDENPDTSAEMVGEENVVTVKLGKFRNVDGDGEGSSTSNNVVDARRCYSMGSLAYVMDEDMTVGRINTASNGNVAAIGRNGKESFSLSKIWLRGNVTE